MDDDELALLSETLRKTMTTTPNSELYSALGDLGWADLLVEHAERAVPLVFRLLGETGTHAPLINDVVRREADLPLGTTVPLPFTGGTWVRWEIARPGEHTPSTDTATIDGELPLHRVSPGTELPLTHGHRALGWWLVGSARAMLTLARSHVLDRHQFGKPVASFQAIRHRLAESLVAIEGAEATLRVAAEDNTGDLGSALAKAAAGKAALTTSRHCQQALGGLGFTAEHDLHRHYRRILIMDGLLGSTRELTRTAGARLREQGTAPRLADLTEVDQLRRTQG